MYRSRLKQAFLQLVYIRRLISNHFFNPIRLSNVNWSSHYSVFFLTQADLISHYFIFILNRSRFKQPLTQFLKALYQISTTDFNGETPTEKDKETAVSFSHGLMRHRLKQRHQDLKLYAKMRDQPHANLSRFEHC